MLISYLLIIGLVFIDQIVKLISFLVVGNNGSPIIIIKNVFEFHYIVNTGASFGMLEGMQWLFSLITLVSLIIFGFFFFEIDFKKKKVFSLAIILLIAGTFGNAIDRIFRDGGVIDMINMPILNNILSLFNISPFIFNVADIYLNFGVILFIIDLLFLDKKRVDLNEENFT